MSLVLSLITDRRRLGAGWEHRLPALVRSAATAGIALIQVRERDLEGRSLAALVRGCVDAVRGTHTRVLVNDRVDVALAAGAHGVHLRGDSVPAATVRAMTGLPFLVGRSVHSADEARTVTKDGHLDYVLFGPVFETSSKPGQRPAGLRDLADVSAAVAVPVLAVGGIAADRLALVASTGAAGAAAIGLFAAASDADLRAIVATSRAGV